MVVTLALTLAKLAVGWMSDSIGVISEGIHSGLDLLSAGISVFTVRAAVQPADPDHPFGHGRFETLSSLLESLLLALAGAWILFEAVVHARHGHAIAHHGAAISVMAGSVALSYWAYRNNLAAGSRLESRALHVNALHFLSDVYAGGGILAGLVLLHFTGWNWIDALIAFAVGLWVVYIALRQVSGAIAELADARLPEDELRRVNEAVEQLRPRLINLHELRSRRSGSYRHIDFHMEVCGHLTVVESHAICDEVETRIARTLSRASVNIHVEPCDHATQDCERVCPLLRKRQGLE